MKRRKYKHFLNYLKIGYQRVQVLAVHRMDRDHDGSYDGKNHLIYVVGNSEIENVNTVMHEALHALWKTQGLKEWVEGDDEEPIVNSLANGLTQVFRDNPKLLEWLKERLHG